MDIVKLFYRIEQCMPYEEALRICELAARTCYKSEDRIDDGYDECSCRKYGTKLPNGSEPCLLCHDTGRVRVREPSSVKLLRRILRSNRREELKDRAWSIMRSEELSLHDRGTAIVDMVLSDIRQHPAHESVVEHVVVSVRFVFDRGVSHELVRHRIGSYSQESTRYCDYGRKGVRVADPSFWPHIGDPTTDAVVTFDRPGDQDRYSVWMECMDHCARSYQRLLDLGAKPQEARSVLTNSTKTEVFTTFNLSQWRHVLDLRTTDACHPQMLELMRPLLSEMKARLPVFFEDVGDP